MRAFARCLLSLSCAALVAQEPAELAELHPDVCQLLARETRDAAMTRILARGIYRGPGKYTEDAKAAQVGHVVMCPQASGPPLFAVFLLASFQKREHQPRGHLIKVAADGAIVRCWRGSNLLDDDAVLADVNGDGVVERVGTMNCGVASGGTVRELFVVAMTEEVEAPLRVAIEFAVDRMYEWQVAWRVVPAKGDEPARIQIGEADAQRGGLAKVVAEWRWHAERRAWVGPGGGPDQPFVRLPPEGWSGLEEFAAAQRAGRDR